MALEHKPSGKVSILSYTVSRVLEANVNHVIPCRLVVFSQRQNFFLIVDKLLPVSNMASSRSEENVKLKHF